jgi:hypothetical protein
MIVMVSGCVLPNFMLVSYHRGSRDTGSEDFEASDGREARLEERPIGERDQGEGLPDLHR